MLKIGLGVVRGFVVWIVVGVIGLLSLKLAWADYAAVIDSFSFTVPMLLARLVVGILNSLAAGWVAYKVAKSNKSPWILGVLLLIYASYSHFVMLWDLFPGWFHFAYILSLLPLIIVGGLIAKPVQQAEACRAGNADNTDAGESLTIS